MRRAGGRIRGVKYPIGARLFDPAQNEHLRVNSPVVSAVPITISAWFYRDDATSDNRTICCVAQYGVLNWFNLLAVEAAPNPAAVWFQSRQGGVTGTVATTANWTLNTWHHACGVSAATNSRAVYLDGGNKNTNANNVTPAALDTTLIAELADWGEPFSGRIADVGIWNAALTDLEVALLASGRYRPPDIRPENLMSFWPLAAGDNRDYIGHYHMTPFNDPTYAAPPPRVAQRFWIMPWGMVTAIPRIPRPPAAYNTLAIY